MSPKVEVQKTDIRDQVPTGLEVLDSSNRVGDNSGLNYAEPVLTGYVDDPEELDGRQKIIVGFIEAAECTTRIGRNSETERAVWLTGTFMHRQVFADIVSQKEDDLFGALEAKHSEAREKMMSLLYERLFENTDQ